MATFYLHAYGLAFLELTFMLVAILLLHRLRPVVGSTAFYLALGMVLVFAQIINAVGLELVHPYLPGLSVQLGPMVFVTTFMVLLLIVYIVDGTLEAQRLIWGTLFVVGFFFFLAYLSEHQVASLFYRVNTRFTEDFVQGVFSVSRLFLMASLLSVLIQFLLLPIIYELLRSRNWPLWAAVAGALICAQVIDAFFYQLVTNPVGPWTYWWDALRHSFIIRAAVMVWASVLAVTYLTMHDTRSQYAQSSRRPLDVVVAFIGSYGQSQRLRANLQEWEGRFRLVVENAHDLILLLGETGAVLDANRQAVATTGYPAEELLRLSGNQLTARGPDWAATWDHLYGRNAAGQWEMRARLHAYEWSLRTRTGQEVMLETTVSPLFLQQQHAVLMVARDVTQRRQLEAELAEKQELFARSQRLEAVGKLAGGVAHDFNNLLHAIQGSIDQLQAEPNREPRQTQLLANIAAATQRAATLTSHLLGFARGGKYQVRPIAVAQLVRETFELFRPLAGKQVTLKLAIHPDPLQITGDFTQLQQVLLNLLLNAREALPETGGTICCRAEPASAEIAGFDRRPATTKGERFVVVRVRDDGCGIDEATMRRIFEPFFTTKQAKGTGLGLAMAYGCIANHSGWIHVVTDVGKGSEFFVFLPRTN